jgi:hypothetical protein
MVGETALRNCGMRDIVVANHTMVFGIYRTASAAEEAVNELLGTGFAGESIFVLHPRNKDTVEFAKKKHTHVPRGTGDGPRAELPLDGSFWYIGPIGPHKGLLHWLMDPSPLGPFEGALHEALAEMGVPDEWCDKRVVRGKLLISVKCNSREEFFQATGVLTFTDSMDISWSAPLDRRNRP